ncbi:DUF4270 domain-containing protein [Flavobacterium hibernum]|uniref:DUF4270 domain-containing protein n=1 Tax=Flavobacterium hibernum TaxID=37752 RepID=A0A0D0EDG7_9FLAO|nr:DUF4270 domain-containing protein [Flavobacterium hibernum]KIO50574.1 hypothetical protein IW18_21705 [Flavobacterium hibernum]OXA87439.1 hypothetical protein B0A73_10965 [Flavobacterium hibernum]STO14307.1 Uncharacterised protein [Flavobacterium hibernum]
MYNTSFIKKILVVATVVLLYSCDKDFNAIGDGLIGDDHFGLELEKYDVLAFNQEVTPVQSNGLTLYGLGIFDNPVFGTSSANFVSQVALETNAPTIGESPEIESVVLTVPYFNHIKSTATDGSNTYVLDSIYGDPNGKIKLSVYESGVQMRSSYFDGGSQFAQLYYSDQDPDFFANKLIDPATNKPLNDDADVSQNEAFFFDPKETVVTTTDDAGKVTTTRTAPQMSLNLNKNFFLNKILKAPAVKLSTPSLFQEYFRGLYFKVEKSGSNPSNLALLDFFKQNGANAKITIKYKAKTAITTDADGTMEEKSLVINLTGAAANLYNDVKNPTYNTAITSPNKTTGDQRLYLKGGQGSLAIIELFGKTDLIGYDANGVLVNEPNGVSDQLDEIRHNVKYKNWLANEANLVFSIDAEKMAATHEPQRVYLYDMDNSLPLVDYLSDGTSGVVNGVTMQKIVYSGIINIDATTKKGKSYKILLTNHLRNIIKNEAVKNVKLGLVVTGNINDITAGKLKNRILIDPTKPNEYFSDLPKASVMSPLGTVLFGSNIPSGDANYTKRLQLQVYYTKPN